jgi:hypothetical protein
LTLQLRGGVAGVEVLDADQQPVDRRGALIDQVVAAVDEQPQLHGHRIVKGDGKVGFTKDRPRYGQSVDGIGLAALARRGSGPAHEVRRDPDDREASG